MVGDPMNRDPSRDVELIPCCTSQGSAASNRRFHFVATVVVLLALTIIVAALRLHRLNENWRGLNFDEAAHGADALRVLQGEHAAFFPENYGREGMIVYAVALTTRLLGRSVLAIRLPTALASSATVLAVFWLGQILFGRDKEGQATPWRGLVVGGIGAGLLAVSVAHTETGRLAYRASFLPLFLCLSLALLWEGWRRRSWWQCALAGVCAGLMPYTYISARFAPILFFLLGISFLLPFRAVARARARAALPWITVFVVVAGLVAAPILVHFALHPDHFFMRSKVVSILRYDHTSPGEALETFLDNLWRQGQAFAFRGDPNKTRLPLLRPWEAVFFWLGTGVAVWRWKRGAAYRLLLLWLGVLILPSMFAESESWHFLRMMGAVPAIYLLLGIGIWEAFFFVRDRLPSRAVFWCVASGGAAASSLILIQGVLTYQKLFWQW